MADDQVDRTNFEPGFNRNLDSFLEDINDRYAAQGITFRPTSGYRSMQEQQQLWDDYQAGKAKGLSDEQLVKAAPPGQSWHNSGGAADVMPFRDGKQLSNEEAIPILKQAGPLASGYGLTWGGGFGDMDHFQGGPKLGDWLDQTRRRNWQAPT